MKKNTNSLPLKGIRILDCSRLIPGPFCSLILSDLGADVVRVEDPHRSDYLRFFPPMLGSKNGALFSAFNRNKKEVSLSLTHKKDEKKIISLIKKSDVLIESFRPGVLAKMGWPLKKIHRFNPKLIVASITGYGQKGFFSNKAGHDLNYMALAGLLNEKGVLPSIQWADLVGGGLMAALLITSHLARRHKKGCHLDISMTDNMAFLGLGRIVMGQVGADSGILSGLLARYRLYKTKDGGCVALAALEDKFFNHFCDLMLKPHLKKKYAYHDRSDSVHHELEELFLSKTQREWSQWAHKHDVCLTPVLKSEDMVKNARWKSQKFYKKRRVAGKEIFFPHLPVKIV